MITSIKQWFASPVFEGDDKKNYRVKLLNVTINLAVCFLVLVVVGNLLDSSTPPRNFVIDFIFIGMFLFLRRLLFADRVKLVGYLILISAGILLTVSVSIEGTILAPATALFSLLVIMSGFIFNLRGIIAATIISSLVVAGLILAHQAGILPPPNYTESTFQWFVFTITFGLTGWLSYFYSQLTDQALERSRMEIRERERAEAELRKLTRAVEQSPASIVITDLSGNIEYVNPCFMKVTGYTFDEAIGKNPRIMKTDKTPPETYLQLWDTLAARKEWHGEFVNRKKDGSLYTESAIISPITDLNGVITHYLAVKEDITERKRADNALRESEERFRMMFESHQAVMLLVEPDTGNILDANHSAEEFYGYPRPTLKTISINKINVMAPDEVKNAIQRAKQGEENHFIFPHRLANGNIRMVEVHSSPLILHGQPALFSIVHDVTERTRAEEKLRQQNEYLSNLHQITLDLLSRKETQTLLNNIAQYAISLVHAQHGFIFLPEGDSFLLAAATSEFAHNIGKREPKPGAGVLGHVWQSMEPVVVEDYSEWEFRDRDYKTEDLRTIAGIPIKIGNNLIGVLEVANTITPRAFTDEELQTLNRFAVLVALVLDNAQLFDAAEHEISERRQAEEKLHQQNEYLSILHQVTLDLLNRQNVDELLQVIVDRSVILLDAPFSELMLEKDGELVVQTFTQNQDSLKGDRVGRAEAKLSWSAFKTKLPAVLDDYSTYPDRREIYSEHALHAVADFPVLIRGKCIGVLAMGRSQAGYVFSEIQIKNGMLFAQLVALVLDSAQLFSAAEHEISERKQAEDALQKANEQLRVDMEKIEQLKEELHEQAIHDPLTGLYNRRYLNETLAREITRVERENNSLSVIMSDIDHFKMINDTYGHPVGDKFLVEIASLMKKHARGSDIVCRYGGEEFLLVLPGTTLDAAEKRAEELWQKCAEIVIQHEGKDLKVTMSFGVATYPDHGKESEEIITKADKALYRAKAQGRNCTVRFE